jgi:hypothetical protein
MLPVSTLLRSRPRFGIFAADDDRVFGWPAESTPRRSVLSGAAVWDATAAPRGERQPGRRAASTWSSGDGAWLSNPCGLWPAMLCCSR